MSTRREKIESMLQLEPHDRFLRYSLAMEYRKEENHAKCIELFDALTQEQPPYVPAFFMAGQQCVQVGEVEKARTYLRNGIEAARLQQDHHSAAEMAELLSQLGAAGE
ncbi:MAG: hypothetical protein U0905_05550 [Pirellulales bacterium]